MTTLPESCIRGPELYDPLGIAAELRETDVVALQAYANGVALLSRAHTLLAVEARLAEAKRIRDFLIGQLVLLEARDTTLFDAALDSYRGASTRSEDPPWQAPLAPSTTD